MKTNVYGLSTGKPYFILENFDPKGLLLAIVPEDDISDWLSNIKTLGTFFGSPPVYAFSPQDKFQKLAVLKAVGEKKSGIIIATRHILTEKLAKSKDLQKHIFEFELDKSY
jgi:hypothetical protein